MKSNSLIKLNETSSFLSNFVLIQYMFTDFYKRLKCHSSQCIWPSLATVTCMYLCEFIRLKSFVCSNNLFFKTQIILYFQFRKMSFFFMISDFLVNVPVNKTVLCCLPMNMLTSIRDWSRIWVQIVFLKSGIPFFVWLY